MTSPPPISRRRWQVGLAASLAALAGCRSLPATPDDDGLDLYLLAGQSNMAGRGALAELPMAERQPDARVLSLDSSGHWVTARHPLHADRPAVAGVGPGLSFARALLAARTGRQGRRIGLVPCAVGGTRLALWQPGGRFEIEPGRVVHPYDDLVARVRLASPAGRWRAVLWQQGESDRTDEDAAVYFERLVVLVQRLRTELQAPDLPVLIGQMGRWPQKPWNAAREAVEQAQRRVVAELPAMAFVPTDGLGLHDDGMAVHFDTAGAVVLGRRYARALLAMPSADR